MPNRRKTDDHDQERDERSMKASETEKLAEIGQKVREGGLKGSERTRELIELGHQKEEENQ